MTGKTCDIRPTLALLLLPLVSCSPPTAEPTRIIELLDRARIVWLGEASASGDLGRLERDQDRMQIELPGSFSWERLDARQARQTGMDKVPDGFSVWRVPIKLPTDDVESVSLWREGLALPRWIRGQVPDSTSWHYQPGGFVPPGVYLAGPPSLDPTAERIQSTFRPNSIRLAEHRARLHEAFLPDSLATHVTTGAVTRPAIFLSPRFALEVPVDLPPDAELRFGLGRRIREQAEAEKTAVRVGIRHADGIDWLFVQDFSGVPDAQAAWEDVRLDLGDRQGAGWLRFEIVGTGAAQIHEHFVTDPVLRSGYETKPATPNLVVVVADGLRADRIGPGRSRELAPRLTRLAERGWAHYGVRAPAPWTRASTAALFTGLSPKSSGVDGASLDDMLAEEVPTLAETLRSNGFSTAAFSANMNLHPHFRLHRGFSHFWCQYEQGDEVNRRAFAWLDQRPHDPFFLFGFYMDTHFPYRHRDEYDLSSQIDIEARSPVTLGSAKRRQERGEAEPTALEIAKLEALYDENVRYVDEQLGALLDGLADRGLLTNTIVVVTADHGEAFGEHGDFFHGVNLYDELLRVPLVIAGPGVDPRRSVEPVSLQQLPRSLLSLLGLSEEALPGAQTLSRTCDDSPCSVHSSTRWRGFLLSSVIRWPFKLIRNHLDQTNLLFDLSQDPGETTDLAGSETERAAALGRDIESWRSEQDRVARSHRRSGDGLDRDTIESLRALGYLQ